MFLGELYHFSELILKSDWYYILISDVETLCYSSFSMYIVEIEQYYLS